MKISLYKYAYIILLFLLFLPKNGLSRHLGYNLLLNTKNDINLSEETNCEPYDYINKLITEYYSDIDTTKNKRINLFLNWLKYHQESIKRKNIELLLVNNSGLVPPADGLSKPETITTNLCKLINNNKEILGKEFFVRYYGNKKIDEGVINKTIGFFLGVFYLKEQYSEHIKNGKDRFFSITITQEDGSFTPTEDNKLSFEGGGYCSEDRCSSYYKNNALIEGLNMGIHEGTHQLLCILNINCTQSLSEFATYSNQTEFALPIKVINSSSSVNNIQYYQSWAFGVRDPLNLRESNKRKDIETIQEEYSGFLIGPIIRNRGFNKRLILKMYSNTNISTNELESLFTEEYSDINLINSIFSELSQEERKNLSYLLSFENEFRISSDKIIKMKSETKRALSNSESEKRDLYTKYSNHEYTKKNSELDKKIEELKAKINNDIENLAKKFFDIAKRYGYYKHQDIPRNYM